MTFQISLLGERPASADHLRAALGHCLGQGTRRSTAREQGFSHVAFAVAGGEDELRRLYRSLLDYGSDVELQADRGLSKRLYFLDPDGNRLEFFYPTMALAAAMAFMHARRAGFEPYDLDPAAVSA